VRLRHQLQRMFPPSKLLHTDSLGQSSGKITTHYSEPDIVRLLQAVELICEQNRMTILWLAAVEGANSGIMAVRQKAAL
jgi:hypothetical protein